MQKTKKWLILALLSLFISNNLWAETAPKREFRSVWIATVANIDWPKQKGNSATVITQQKADLLAYIERMQEMNLTTICFQVRSMCDAMYKSSYEPWSSYLTSTRGKDPGWDPLQFVCDECHKRGLEVYAWVNPYRWSSTGTTSTWNTDFDTQVKNDGWLITNGTFTVLNPGLDATREHIVKVCKEIIEKYPVEGMIFDDYFYPTGGTSEGTDAPDYQLWKNSGTSLSIGDWRRLNVDNMITDVYNMVQQTRPEVRFGLAPPGTAGASASKYGLSIWPGGYDTQYTSLYSDPLSWMNKGIVDYMSPQIYWHNDHSMASFGKISNWWYGLAKHFKNVHCSISVNIYDLAQAMGYQEDLKNTQAHWEEHVYNVKQSRQFAADNGVKAFGSNFYSIQYFCGEYEEHGDFVAKECFPTKALVPEIDWKTVTNYGAVKNLNCTNGTLSWDAVTGPHKNTIIRYSTYAVPLTVSHDEAMTDDGIDGQYLMDVTYSPSFAVPTDKQSGYWYAVCVYDGFGKEHSVAYANYPEGNAEKVTLVAPINGASTSWSQTFSWSAIDNGTYELEISDNSSFSSITYNVAGLTTNSTSIDFTTLNLTSGQTYYWRVISLQPGKLQETSDATSFKAPVRSAAPAPTLISPNNGVELDSEITFSWSLTDNYVASYTLQISDRENFDNITLSKDIIKQSNGTTSVNVPLYEVGKGTFYWRVVAKGGIYTDTPSATRLFTVTSIGVGEYESGYTIKVDPSSYSDKDGIAIESVWMRSVKNGFNNMSFANSGSLNRTMVAVGDYVYLSGRMENSSSATAFLEKYSAFTGEHIGRLILGSEATMGYFPCNNVTKDSYDNVCISNLVMMNRQPLVLHLVNLETGAVTEIARIQSSNSKISSGRFDRIAVVGDITTGNFTVLGVPANSKYIVRWTFANGSYTEEIKTISAFYPTSATNFSTAPFVLPITADDMFVDCASTSLTRYTFSTATRSGSFLANPSVAPNSDLTNGGTFFTIGNNGYVAYAYDDAYSSDSHKFNLVKTTSDFTYGGMKQLWVLPENGLGSVWSETYACSADYRKMDNNCVRLFLYVPGCGLCAYDVTDVNIVGLEDIIDNSPSPLEPIEYYNLQGVKVNADNLTPGLYITRQGNKTSKMIIK